MLWLSRLGLFARLAPRAVLMSARVLIGVILWLVMYGYAEVEVSITDAKHAG